MAKCETYETPSAERNEEQDEEPPKCTVCLDVQRDPRLLPCLHSYCKPCLEAILEKSMNRRILTCPQCRSSHAIPHGGINGFPQDQVLSNTVEVNALRDQLERGSTEKKPPQCNMCTEDDPATSFCSICGKYLCKFCETAHKRQVDFCSHNLTSLSELTSESIASFTHCPVRCTTHAGEILKLYCKTCHKLICCVCTVIGHRDHVFGFTKDIRPQIQRDVMRTATKLRLKQQEYESHLGFLIDMEKQRIQHSSQLKKEIQENFDTHIKALQNDRDELIEREEKMRSVDCKQITTQKQNVEMTLANLSSALRYIDRLCDCLSDTVMLTMRNQAIKQFKSLQSSDWDATQLNLSTPNLFIDLSSQFTSTGSLKPLSLGDMSVSIREPDDSLSSSSTAERIVKLGERVRLIIEMKCSKINHPIVPLLQFVNHNAYNGLQNQVAVASYTCKYHGSGEWDVNFIPLQSGQLSLFVDTSPSTKQHPCRLDQFYERPSCHIRVKGTPQMGSRVRRGPNWCSSESDGGNRGEGTVVNIIPDYSHHCAMYSGKRRRRMVELLRKPSRSTIHVKWDNGNEGQYRWDESTGLCEIELTPFS